MMKKIYFLIIITLTANNLFAQTETENYKIVVDKFVRYYNSSQPDSVFKQFSSEMKTALPIEKVEEFVNGLKQQLGKIKSRDFLKYELTLAKYKTQFDNGVFTLNVSIDKALKIDGLYVKPYIPDSIPIIERNTTKLILPFKDEWFVVWGGDTEELNYHVIVKSQKNAFDMLIVDKADNTNKNNGEVNKDYYCFGKELIAPCNAEIILAVDGIKDNKPGELNSTFPLGNTVVLKTENNEYLYFCHFKQFSIKVKQGQKVKQGELLGLCGNSGRSSEAHLHFHIQNTENMAIATGVKCYFENIIVNGKLKTDYSPIKNEIIKNK
jgi:Peptidase family M23/Protein of unknown function (DUF3887)